jgi:putative hydrolase of the HAD superfamily
VRKSAVLFDLGGTLAYYYDMSEFPSILQHAISDVQSYLSQNNLLTVTPEIVRSRVRQEDHESADFQSRPLEARLRRIFDIELSTGSDEFVMELCKRFMAPIFARGTCYEDTVPALKEVRARGLRTAIVSNTSWGSPAALWRNEIGRLGLDSYMNAVVLDRDVGWRKPSERIFEFALKKLGANPTDCLFVGDHPKWDVIGPYRVGMEAVLIDRKTVTASADHSITNLQELVAWL